MNDSDARTTQTEADADARHESVSQESAVQPGGGPDIDRVCAGDWPQRSFPIDDGRRREPVRIVLKQSVLNDIHRHGQGRTDVEICGVLIGNGYRDERGPFVYIEGNIRGSHSDSQVAQVTFTGETWNHIHNELDSKYPDLRILGWYHTHPGFGIFLSGMDLFIHENYFNADEQLALVYDPLGGEEGLFVWRGGQALREGFLVEHDAEENPPVRPKKPRSEPRLTAGATGTKSDETQAATSAKPRSRAGSDNAQLLARIERLEQRQNLGVLGLLAVAFLAIVGPIAAWFLATSALLSNMMLSPESTNPPRQSQKLPPTTPKEHIPLPGLRPPKNLPPQTTQAPKTEVPGVEKPAKESGNDNEELKTQSRNPESGTTNGAAPLPEKNNGPSDEPSSNETAPKETPSSEPAPESPAKDTPPKPSSAGPSAPPSDDKPSPNPKGGDAAGVKDAPAAAKEATASAKDTATKVAAEATGNPQADDADDPATEKSHD